MNPATNITMQDSTNTTIHTELPRAVLETAQDSMGHSAAASFETTAAVVGNTKPVQRVATEPAAVIREKTEVKPVPVSEEPAADSIEVVAVQQEVQKHHEPSVPLFTLTPHTDALFSYPPEKVWQTSFTLPTRRSCGEPVMREFQRTQMNWTLLVGLVCGVLLLSLKLYYNKFIGQVFNTLVNFQLADTLLREKNVITRRAFLMLNSIYVLVLSLFIFLLAQKFGLPIHGRQPLIYLYILLGFTGLVLVRMLVYYLTGFCMEWLSAITQQIHMNYLVNKNLGLLLLPLVFMSIYSNFILSGVFLYIALALVLLGSLYKLIRGFQIIIRNGVSLFYAILYLCTLEIVPIAIVSKMILMLR